MRYFLYKLSSFITTIIIVSIMIFFVFQLLPGNPAQIILGIDADPHQVAQLEKQLGLDRSPVERYMDWVTGVLQGDLGESLRYQLPVSDIVIDRMPVTASLAILSLLFTVVIGVPLGIFIARSDGKWISIFLNVLTQLGISIPSFWFGFILILIFGVTLQLFPTYGYVPWSEDFLGALRSFFLPSFAIAIGNIAIVIRYLRNTILDQSKMDYVRTARVKGLKERSILYGHILRNSLIPVLTIMGLLIADTLGGSIIIENVFSLPGLGNLLIQSITSRDFPLVQSMVLYIAIIVLLINFIVDMLYKVIDPRIRLKG
ncbi:MULTISPECIES: ABC transporter permease [Bacillaceae]|uniref:Peptide ABC transporter permease n=1 Tax=Oceanobacillus caeni TaxID=405946 RepID=A0ABR5MMG9_9BACI|nr:MULTISPECIES: ABC transporter permease [Bacillaceae]KKE80212.1 peptide ABC transporter permease [Bacilli bacterium VT-13-104]PZD88036.1 ABC transporter permease [Bacilli bacterium]KPH77855.1 peptide ABC transporter permease [Oceanobacillus caeni]MED4474054.1 ABC transporter permease [Oceanobacillus caeni]PZD90227.1 ABC transporter permease [Bacilli bacterium]